MRLNFSFALLFFCALAVLSANAQAQTASIPLTDQELASIISDFEVQVDVYGTWANFDRFENENKYKLKLVEGDWYEIDKETEISGQDVSWKLDLDNAGEHEIFIKVLEDEEYRIYFVRSDAQGFDTKVKMYSVRDKKNCLAEKEEWIHYKMNVVSNTTIEGTRCGIKLSGDWEATGYTEIKIDKIFLHKSLVNRALRRALEPVNKQRRPTAAQVKPLTNSLLDQVVINAHEEGGTTPYVFSLMKTDPSGAPGFSVDMGGTNLSFDLDNEKERSMEIIVGKRTVFQVKLESPEDAKAKFIVDRFPRINYDLSRPAACHDEEVVQLERNNNKYTRELCGIKFGANWETLTTEVDVDIEDIWITRDVVVEAVTAAVQKRDIIASMVFSAQADELNKVIRFIDAFDVDQFQIMGDAAIYTGVPFGLTEPGLWESEKDKYMAITEKQKIKYVLYTPQDIGQNTIQARKVTSSQEGTKIGPDGINSIDAFVDFFEKMQPAKNEEISGEDVANVVTFGGTTKEEALAYMQRFENPETGSSDVMKYLGVNAAGVALASGAELIPAGKWNPAQAAAAAKVAGVKNVAVTGFKDVLSTATTKTKTVASSKRIPIKRATAAKRIDKYIDDAKKIQQLLRDAAIARPNSTTIPKAVNQVTSSIKKMETIKKGVSGSRAAKNLALAANQSLKILREEVLVSATSLQGHTNWGAQAKRFFSQINKIGKSALAYRQVRPFVTTTTKTVTNISRTYRVLSTVGKGGLAVWRTGGAVLKAALLPAGPVGWGVLVVLTAADAAMLTYDYTSMNVNAFDDGVLVVGWDKALRSTYELKVDWLYYRKDPGSMGDPIAVFAFEEAELEGLKEAGIVKDSIQELLTKKIVSLHLAKPKELEENPQGKMVVKLDVIEDDAAVDADGNPVMTTTDYVVQNDVPLTFEKSGEIEILVGHNIVPGEYVFKWNIPNKGVLYQHYIIGGIDDGTGTAMDLDDDGEPDADLPVIYEGMV